MSEIADSELVKSDVTIPVRGKEWECWISNSSPFKCRTNGRNTYAKWLREEDIPSQKGLYIWLAPRPSSLGEYRFVHIGISAKGNSTLAIRTMAHCRNQFSIDRVHTLTPSHGHDFGSLGDPIPRENIKVDQVAENFLKDLRVMFLIRSGAGASDIREMEGLIAYTASHMFNQKPGEYGEKEITNTMSKVRNPHATEEEYKAIAKALNKILEILPEEPLKWPSKNT